LRADHQTPRLSKIASPSVRGFPLDELAVAAAVSNDEAAGEGSVTVALREAGARLELGGDRARQTFV
jgi:hypothetical protein